MRRYHLAWGWTFAAIWLLSSPVAAQVALSPTVTEPGTWERFVLRVVNQTDTPTVAVRLIVPQAVLVLGIDAPPGWTIKHATATDSLPQTIDWSGGPLERGGFREFAFLGRLEGNARPGSDLVFPARITRANGTEVEWKRGGAGAPFVVRIRGSTLVSAAGAVALAGAAVGLSVLALGLALSRGRSSG